MLSREEAEACAERELRHDSELLGHEIVPGPGHETQQFWVFHPNRPGAFASRQASESLSYRIPPLVVNKITGFVTRPVAAGSPVRAADLGPDEWFIASPPERAAEHGPLEGLKLADDDLTALRKLAHFRVRRGGRDSGDTLAAQFVATSPDAIAPGLAEAGLHPADPHGWSFGTPGQISGRVYRDAASVHLTLSGNGFTDNSWTIGTDDIRLAERVEDALDGAPWIRFWY